MPLATNEGLEGLCTTCMGYEQELPPLQIFPLISRCRSMRSGSKKPLGASCCSPESVKRSIHRLRPHGHATCGTTQAEC